MAYEAQQSCAMSVLDERVSHVTNGSDAMRGSVVFAVRTYALSPEHSTSQSIYCSVRSPRRSRKQLPRSRSPWLP